MDIKIARRVGRVLCAGLFLLWGMFFIEHLGMFSQASGELPPLYVWLVQIAHGLLLISYLVCFKFDKPGSLGILLFGLTFFISVGAAWYLLVLSLSPILFFAYGWLRSRWMTKPLTS